MEPSLPATTTGEHLSWYFQRTRSFPMLSAEVERTLCCRWRDHHDIRAAHQIVGSHLRLVVKITKMYRGYGLQLEDLLGEGQVGMMRALCRFDPDRGVRFATYALWWVRAAIQEYILHNWSMVKMGTTASQKKLFFNLRRMRGRLQAYDEGALTPEQTDEIAERLQVSEHDVHSMDLRMAGPDRSLNAPVGMDSAIDWQTALIDEGDNQETLLADYEETMRRRSLLPPALRKLTTRERAHHRSASFGREPVELR
jgi:RNA polymerase sigma-32 factor